MTIDPWLVSLSAWEQAWCPDVSLCQWAKMTNGQILCWKNWWSLDFWVFPDSGNQAKDAPEVSCVSPSWRYTGDAADSHRQGVLSLTSIRWAAQICCHASRIVWSSGFVLNFSSLGLCDYLSLVNTKGLETRRIVFRASIYFVAKPQDRSRTSCWKACKTKGISSKHHLENLSCAFDVSNRARGSTRLFWPWLCQGENRGICHSFLVELDRWYAAFNAIWQSFRRYCSAWSSDAWAIEGVKLLHGWSNMQACAKIIIISIALASAGLQYNTPKASALPLLHPLPSWWDFRLLAGMKAWHWEGYRVTKHCKQH